MTQRSRREAAPSETQPETWASVPPQPGPATPDIGSDQANADHTAWPTEQTPGDPVATPDALAPTEPDVVTPPAKVRSSRFGGLWIGLIVAAVLLVLLLIFILQNSQSVQIDYFGWTGHIPLAVAMLLGVAAGALIVAVPGTVRILQLRRQVRKH